MNTPNTNVTRPDNALMCGSDEAVTYGPADRRHLSQLLALEEKCFSTDRLSRRSMQRFLASDQSIFLVATQQSVCVGYILVIFHRGTRLARLYSLAVDPAARGLGVGRQLLVLGEQAAQNKGGIYFRLEVNHTNTSAIGLYQSMGFKEFGLLQDYYEDHAAALRMQKRIRHFNHTLRHSVIPWFRQSTPFTCGPASLMMAMAALDPQFEPSISVELQLWREATTIFMTSGHGGCHPLGLALAAKRRGFGVEVWISQREPLFIDGVRSASKKAIMTQVHDDFVVQSQQANITIHYGNIEQTRLIEASASDEVSLVLISTYRMDSKKAPHWVVISGDDERCFYVHDPDPEEKDQDLFDCQYMPITKEDFDPMSSFGQHRLRTAVILSKPSS